MFSSGLPLKWCIFVLSILFAVVTATASVDAALSLRQAGAATPVTCLDYSRIANLSTISLNSTYRAAYLQAAPDGTEHSASLLNDAQAKLPPLTKNAALNEQCGNLTTIALTEAASNFTRGIVAQYRISAGTRNQGLLGGVVLAFWVTLGVVTMT
jgi:hypothetical protein